jgi:hypothetical protein
MKSWNRREALAAAVSLTLGATTLAARAQGLGSATRSSAASSAASAAVRAAFRAVLAQPSVRNAARVAILQQLPVNRPVALMNGMWVTPVDMGLVYGNPGVKPALVTQLGPNGVALVDGAMLDPGRLGLTFTPAQLGKLLMGDLAKDILGSFAPGALQSTVTDGSLIGELVVVMFAVSVAIVSTALFMEYVHHGSSSSPSPPSTPPPNTPYGDPDKDGIESYKDPDDDGDGYNDEDDYYPDDPNKHICDCGRPHSTYFFGRSITPQVVNAVQTAAATMTSQLRASVSLGTAASSTSAAVRIIVP